MKLLYFLAFVILGFTTNAQSPIANAGPDQTIYLTQTSNVTLNGSASSGDSYKWTEVSTDYKSGATISSPNSAVTTVTGLPQGVFYFQLAVTTAGVTTTDVVVVNVDYDVAPANSTLVTHTIWADMAYGANLRDDTTTCYSWTGDIHSLVGNDPNAFVMEKDGTLGSSIDKMNQKYYSTLNDGHGCSGYGRSEIIPSSAVDKIDTSKTYVIEWKGYFPQDMSTVAVSDYATVIGQIHGNDGYSPPFSFKIRNNNIYFAESFENGNGQGSSIYNPVVEYYTEILPASDLVNHAHTFRVTVREGSYYPNQKAFIKIEIDGVQKYYRNSGQVGATLMEDWIKGATMYDHSNLITDANNYTRGRKVSLTTESYNIYTISDNQLPVANAGSDQTITLPTNSVNLSGTGSVSGGSIQNYNWTKLSGPTGETITSPNSSSTSVTNLVQGTYIFQLKVTDNNGASATSSVQVTVNATAQNSPPKANAGDNQIITLPTNSADLSGSASDSDGTIASYLWTKTAGPSQGAITSSSSSSTSITGLVQGSYTFQLKVVDNNGASGTDTVNVTVLSATNISPIAKAGNDTTITLPLNYLTLNGKGIDQDGNIASYKWTEISGDSAVTISSVTSATTDIKNLIEGNYQFELEVTDNQGATGKDTVLVSVKAGANLIPNVSAGANETIALPTNSVVLNGTANDSDGSITSFAWTKTGGPSQGTISDSTSASTSVNGLVQGDYTFTLKATDNLGAVGKDTVHVKVNAANNLAPTAIAGTDQAITLPNNTVNLSGSGSDSDGSISKYIWSKVSGPSTFTIADSSSPSINVSGLIQGVYQFELKVIDNNGSEGKDTVEIQVNAANNISPSANAGVDQTITLPVNEISLSGSATDSDGTISTYKWSKISGPSSSTIKKPNAALSTVTNLVQGVYQFELKVTDDKGGIGKDTVQVTVNAASVDTVQTKENVAPIASAGSDQTITLPANYVTLSGSGTDSDGSISKYYWSKISGPSTFKISDSSSAGTSVSEMVQGVYQFELKVTDDKGGIGKDTVQVTVNAATNVDTVQTNSNLSPKANAGSDQVITLPINSVTVSGSGNDIDGVISSYTWTRISGPSSFSIQNSSSPVAIISGLIAGVYQFELKVTDDKGAAGKDTVQVTVNSVNNMAPTADAGSDIEITLPIDSIKLLGTGRDSDGTISGFMWTKISGPSSYTISSPTSATTVVNGLVQGIYEFELKVTDDKGSLGRDTIKVTVNSEVIASTPVNQAPIVNAGSDITIVSTTNSIMLKGSGTDVDGQIKSYLWKQLSGPSSSTISSPNSLNTKVSNFIQGTYEFELTGIDDKGAVGKDSVKITVAMERVATETTTTSGLNVYPNPVHDIANLQFTTSESNSNISIVISDMSGKTVYTRQFVSASTNVLEQIDMSNLIKGIYSVSVYIDGMQQQSVKVVKL